MSHPSSIIPQWLYPSTLCTTQLRVGPLCIEMCTICMVLCSIKSLIRDSWRGMVRRDRLFWLDHSTSALRNTVLTGLVTIGKDLKSSKQQYRCYFLRVSPVFHSVAQMCLPSQVSTPTTQSWTAINLASSCLSSELTVTCQTPNESLGYCHNERRMPFAQPLLYVISSFPIFTRHFTYRLRTVCQSGALCTMISRMTQTCGISTASLCLAQISWWVQSWPKSSSYQKSPFKWPSMTK